MHTGTLKGTLFWVEGSPSCSREAKQVVQGEQRDAQQRLVPVFAGFCLKDAYPSGLGFWGFRVLGLGL